jgi:hypothetical protein
LPAAGFATNHNSRRFGIGADGGYSQDQLLFAGELEPKTKDRAGGHGAVYSYGYPTKDERLLIGGMASAAQQAGYFLGPTWADTGLQVEALDLWSALIYADYEPKDWFSVEYDMHQQSVGLYRVGVIESGDGGGPDLVEPNFLDNRARAGIRPFDRGWLRGEGRLRSRPVTADGNRNETRLGASAEVDNFGVKGPFLKGKVFRDFITAPVGEEQADRLFWTAGGGYEDQTIDIEVGGSFLERATDPVSGRLVDPSDPRAPTSSGDLSPFLLEAQEVAYLRAFVNRRNAFSGLDFEYNLHDGEFRVFFQIGAITSAGWGS